MFSKTQIEAEIENPSEKKNKGLDRNLTRRTLRWPVNTGKVTKYHPEMPVKILMAQP